MTGMRRVAVFFLAALALASIAGCGSGGTSSSVSAGSGRAALDVYVTDGFTDQYKQVIATLYKIELTTDGTNFQTVYDNTAGSSLDLASLASTAELLASVTVPAGTYTEARITFGDHITLVSNSGTSTSIAVDPTVGTAANGQVSILVNTPTKVQANQSNTVFVDFRLAEFQLVGNVVRPSVHCGNGDAGMLNRQHTANVRGTVTGLIGTTGFTLQDDDARTVTVTLTDSTTVTSGQTGAAITLATGQSVIVRGTFDPASATITATSVTLNDYTTVNHARAAGTVASVNTSGSSFVLTVLRADGITPTGGTITVQTDASTHFGRGRHQQFTLADLTTGEAVEVSGVFDTTTQTLTAKFVGIHP